MDGRSRRFENLTEAELVRAVEHGLLSHDQLNAILQARARRAAAASPDTPDATHRHTVEGFGSGQGMSAEQTGQEPGAPDEQGNPRGVDPDWPG